MDKPAAPERARFRDVLGVAEFRVLLIAQAVPDGLCGRAIGVASAGLQTAQGLGVLLAGAIAELAPPSASITVCALLGAGGAIVISLTCGLAAPTGTAPAPASTPPGPGRQPRPVQPR
jgi:hypothetical protein